MTKYKTCTSYLWGKKREQTIRIGIAMLTAILPGSKFLYTDSMFPYFGDEFIYVQRLGVNIAATKSYLHENTYLFTFFLTPKP